MRGWLRISAAVILVAGVGCGTALMLMSGRVLFTAGDCPPPLGYTGGGYRCYTTGHPHAVIGVVVVLVGLFASVILWGLSYRRSVAS